MINLVRFIQDNSYFVLIALLEIKTSMKIFKSNSVKTYMNGFN